MNITHKANQSNPSQSTGDSVRVEGGFIAPSFADALPGYRGAALLGGAGYSTTLDCAHLQTLIDAYDAAPVVHPDAADQWQDINTLRASNDLIWLYNRDTNTVDGPVEGGDHFVDSWTHWAPAEAPSTAAIDAALAQQAAPARGE